MSGIFMPTSDRDTQALYLGRHFGRLLKVEHLKNGSMNTVRDLSEDAFKYLMEHENAKPEYWCRAFFYASSTCANVDDNMCETFNGYILKARKKPLISMLEDIRVSLILRIIKQRKEMLKRPRDPLYPRIRDKLEENKKTYRCWKARRNGDGMFEVRQGNDGYVVDMNRVSCTCMMWDSGS